MGKRDEMYSVLKALAEEQGIVFECYLGRHADMGELCVDHNDLDGYILFAYDRDLECLHYTTTDFEELKYRVFKELCWGMGLDYELKNRKIDISSPRDDNDLSSDTRKVHFEHMFHLMNKINPAWVDKAIPEYEGYMNLHRENKNVYFNKETMLFQERQ